MTQFNDINFLL